MAQLLSGYGFSRVLNFIALTILLTLSLGFEPVFGEEDGSCIKRGLDSENNIEGAGACMDEPNLTTSAEKYTKPRPRCGDTLSVKCPHIQDLGHLISRTKVVDQNNYNVAKKLEKYDLRTDKKKSKMCPSLHEINDQGGCDSCWAVATTDVITDRLCLLSKGRLRKRFSPADPLSCCKACRDVNAPHTCSKGSGFHEKVWPYWVQCGIVSGNYYEKINSSRGCFNYNVQGCKHHTERVKRNIPDGPKCIHDYIQCNTVNRDEAPTCSYRCEKGFKGMSFEDDKDIGKGEKCYSIERKFDGEEDMIKADIYQNGPVHMVISIRESFYNLMTNNVNENGTLAYEGEIYRSRRNDTDSACGGHSVRIVGWDNKDGKSYWIAANTYGGKWGTQNGFFYVDFMQDFDLERRYRKDRVYAGLPQLY